MRLLNIFASWVFPSLCLIGGIKGVKQDNREQELIKQKEYLTQTVKNLREDSVRHANVYVLVHDSIIVHDSIPKIIVHDFIKSFHDTIRIVPTSQESLMIWRIEQHNKFDSFVRNRQFIIGVKPGLKPVKNPIDTNGK